MTEANKISEMWHQVYASNNEQRPHNIVVVNLLFNNTVLQFRKIR